MRIVLPGSGPYGRGAMIIFLPLVLMFLLVSAFRGGTNVVLLLPMLLMLGAGAVFMTIAMRDGRSRRRDRSVPVMPTHPLSRQIHSALRTHRPKRSAASPSRGVMPFRSRSGPRTWR
jgi:hypothetical protein